ncbi:MOSC domain-containing protein [Nocardioides sp. AN3]
MKVVGVWRYPVKSLQGEALDAEVIESDGLAGDRRWGLRDELTGRILTARRRPELLHAAACEQDGVPLITLPDREQAYGPGHATDRLLSAWLGSPVSLVSAVGASPGRAEFFEDATDDTSRAIEWTMPESRYVDAGALLVLTTASLRTARALHPAGFWEPRRFRPNLLIEDDAEGWTEDAWLGQRLQVGAATLTPDQGCIRCTMVTREQPGIDADREIFRVLARHHGARFGLWCDVAEPGRVAIGDAASVLMPRATAPH